MTPCQRPQRPPAAPGQCVSLLSPDPPLQVAFGQSSATVIPRLRQRFLKPDTRSPPRSVPPHHRYSFLRTRETQQPAQFDATCPNAVARPKVRLVLLSRCSVIASSGTYLDCCVAHHAATRATPRLSAVCLCPARAWKRVGGWSVTTVGVNCRRTLPRPIVASSQQLTYLFWGFLARRRWRRCSRLPTSCPWAGLPALPPSHTSTVCCRTSVTCP